MSADTRDPIGDVEEPSRLGMFRKGPKKWLRLKGLQRLLLPIAPPHARCLLVTPGVTNSTMIYFFRELDGRWSWADLEDTSIGSCVTRRARGSRTL